MADTPSTVLAAIKDTIMSLNDEPFPTLPPVALVLHPTLATTLEALASSLEKMLYNAEAPPQAKGYIEKYWPLVAGLLIALTRLVK